MVSRPPRAPVLFAAAAAAGLALFFPAVRFFLDLPSFLITVGGTAMVTLVSFSLPELSRTARLVMESVRSSRPSLDEIALAIPRLAALYRREGVKRLEAAGNALADPFLRLAIGKVADWESEVKIVECLADELAGFEREVEAAGRVLQMIGRLLPAFGLIGTLISLVLLLRATAVPDPMAMAPSLSLALLTTLYGALLANAVVLPLATKVDNRGEARLVEMKMIAEGAVMMARGERPARIAEHLTALARAVEGKKERLAEGLRDSAKERASSDAGRWARTGLGFYSWSALPAAGGLSATPFAPGAPSGRLRIQTAMRSPGSHTEAA